MIIPKIHLLNGWAPIRPTTRQCPLKRVVVHKETLDVAPNRETVWQRASQQIALHVKVKHGWAPRPKLRVHSADKPIVVEVQLYEVAVVDKRLWNRAKELVVCKSQRLQQTPVLHNCTDVPCEIVRAYIK